MRCRGQAKGIGYAVGVWSDLPACKEPLVTVTMKLRSDGP